MFALHRRNVLGTLAGILAILASPIAARAAEQTFALVQINQQALFFNQMPAPRPPPRRRVPSL